jgi:hypothetical protein
MTSGGRCINYLETYYLGFTELSLLFLSATGLYSGIESSDCLGEYSPSGDTVVVFAGVVDGSI